MKKDNPLMDVKNITREEFEDSKAADLNDLMEVPAGSLFASLIASIADPEKGNGAPAMMKIKHNGAMITLIIGIYEAKIIGAGSETVN